MDKNQDTWPKFNLKRSTNENYLAITIIIMILSKYPLNELTKQKDH